MSILSWTISYKLPGLPRVAPSLQAGPCWQRSNHPKAPSVIAPPSTERRRRSMRWRLYIVTASGNVITCDSMPSTPTSMVRTLTCPRNCQGSAIVPENPLLESLLTQVLDPGIITMHHGADRMLPTPGHMPHVRKLYPPTELTCTRRSLWISEAFSEA